MTVEMIIQAPPRLANRAMAAWFRSARGNYQGVPSDAHACVVNGLRYVVLSDDTELLAVYRLTNHGDLKRLKQWPAELKGVTRVHSE